MKHHQNTTKLLRYKHFAKDERNELAILLKKGYSLRNIARVLGRSPASVSREVKRNNVKGEYVPDKAQHKAYVKRLYSKYQGMKIRENQFLANYICEKIKLGWSPERISGRLRLETGYPISFKAVYKYLYHNPFGWPLVRYLKYKGKKRKKKSESKLGEIIKNRVFIGQRPKVINQRLRYGDFEADTMGKSKEASSETLAVVRERKSRYIMARKVNRLKFAIDGFKDLLSLIPVKCLDFRTPKEIFEGRYLSKIKGSVLHLRG